MADASYGWVIVSAAGVMACVTIGALFALPVLLTPMVAATGWSRSGISAAMTIAFLSIAAMAMIWRARSVVMAGAALFSVSLWAAGHASSLFAF